MGSIKQRQSGVANVSTLFKSLPQAEEDTKHKY